MDTGQSATLFWFSLPNFITEKRKNCCTSDQRMNCLNYKKWEYHADCCFLPDSQVNVANFRCSSTDHWRLYWLSLFLHYKEDQVHLTSLWEPRCWCWQTKTASGSRPDPRGHVGARSAVPGGKPRRSLEQTLTTRDGPLGRLLEVRTVPQALWGVTTIAPAPINTFPPDHLTSIRFRCCSQLKLWLASCNTIWILSSCLHYLCVMILIW